MNRYLPLSLLLVACSGSTPDPAAYATAKPTVTVQPHPSLSGLSGTRWRGAAPKLDVETGANIFDFDDPSVAYEMVLDADGTGRTRWSLWSLACKDGTDVCAMTWSVEGRQIILSPSWDSNWKANWYAILVDGNLQLSSGGAAMSAPTGTLKLYEGRMKLDITEGSCTYAYPGHQTHTGPCEWVEQRGYRELRYEESSLSGNISERSLRWYTDQGIITPPPAHLYRPIVDGE